MSRLRELLRRYPLVAAVVIAGIVTGILVLAGLEPAGRWVATIAAAGIALVEAIQMLRDLRSGRWGLDILAILAIGSTAVLGDYWASLIVALMMSGGAALEDYATSRARAQLRALLERVPRRARRLGASGHPEEVDVEEVVPGDVLLITPGETVPVDGTLLDEEADFDESSLTGESLPVAHRSGDAVLSGAVNGSAPVRVAATARAEDSQYQQIVRLVQTAAETRGRFIRLADRYSIPFTIVALGIGGVAWALAGDPTRFAEVLVVATPCPLLIAAPVAFVAGMGRAAKEGVVIKSGESLERLAHPRTAAFDKTGTLTTGRPEVSRIEAFGSQSEREILQIAAGAEGNSNHVLARAVLDAAASRSVEPAAISEVEEVTAHGILGTLSGRRVVVGKATFVAGMTRAFTPGALAAGEMAIYVGVGTRPAGRIVLRDEVRAESASTVAQLRDLGVGDVVIVTGDALATARHVGAAVGITDVRAGLLPADKVREIASLPRHPVLMIGDGVNDAPVLAAADVGIAMGARGSTAASETADVVILLDDIARVATAVRISQRTLQVARQSIALGIGLSVIFMLVAAAGVLPALAGALIQEGIDVATIVNGLRAGRGARARDRRHPHRPVLRTAQPAAERSTS